MEKLRTLEDLEFDVHVCGGYDGSCHVNEDGVRNELKQEAIKWIKELRRTPFEKRIQGELWTDDWHDYDEESVIGFIKVFFNITKEDLK